MLDSLPPSDIALQLRRCLEAGKLPESARAHAEAMFNRLLSGVRVVVFGPTGIGKTALYSAMQAQQPSPLGHAQIEVADAENKSALPQEVFGTADIILWCTQSFSNDEMDLWSGAPDALKDHSFLVLTKADILAQRGSLQQEISRLQGIAEEEFHSFYPTTTQLLLSEQRAGRMATPAQWAASGLKALVDNVRKLVVSGQQADIDSAVLLLERYGQSGQSYDRAETSPSPEAAPTSAVKSYGHYQVARDAIMARAFDLAELSFDDVSNDFSDVLELCGTISEEMTEHLDEVQRLDATVKPWCAAFEEASDKIMLMTMENDTRSAADAVTILLQLRRDLECMEIH